MNAARAQTPPFQVIIAHSLGIYSSALAGLLQEIRPALMVRRVEIDELHDSARSTPGALVIADRVNEAIEDCAIASILYYPDQQNVAVVIAGGLSRTIENPAWEDLLEVIDHVVAGVRTTV
jgi:hypothetical protein